MIEAKAFSFFPERRKIGVEPLFAISSSVHTCFHTSVSQLTSVSPAFFRLPHPTEDASVCLKEPVWQWPPSVQYLFLYNNLPDFFFHLCGPSRNRCAFLIIKMTVPVCIKIAQKSARFQHTYPFLIRLSRVFQIPGNISGKYRVKFAVSQFKLLASLSFQVIFSANTPVFFLPLSASPL